MIRKFANLRIIKHRSILPPLQGSPSSARFPGAPPRAIFFPALQAVSGFHFPNFAFHFSLTFMFTNFYEIRPFSRAINSVDFKRLEGMQSAGAESFKQELEREATSENALT
jgi:hypothetical protein